MQKIFILFLIFNFNLCQEKEFEDKINNISSNNSLINQNFFSINNMRKKKNLIIGIIQAYSLDTILPFFNSILYTHFYNCDIVMFVRNVSQILIRYLKGIGVYVYEISKEYKKVPAINLRWKMYIDFLKERKNEYNIVFSSDVRDTFFQKDVFKIYENHEPFLGVAIEDGTLNEEVNKKWIIDFVGEEIHKEIKNEKIICVGSIWGTLDKFLEFSSIFWEKLLINHQNVEQGIANYLFYYKKIFQDCIVKSDNSGPIMTLALTKPENIILDKENNILNFKGEVAAVIHQYDRNHDLTVKVINKYCLEVLFFNKTSNEYNDLNNKSLSKQTQKIKEYYKNIIFFILILDLFSIILLIKKFIKKIRKEYI